MFVYRVIFAVLLPVLLIRALWRGEGWADVAQRLGAVPVQGGGPAIWLHGASNGELTSARWLVARMVAARPGLRVLVTCNTLTARAMVQAWQMNGVTAALAPVDMGFAVRRLLRRWQPQALISLEAELWPVRFATCAGLGVPVVVVGARMSARSARRWAHIGRLVAGALAQVSYASAQDAVSRGHLCDLGLNPAVVGPDFDLKAQAVASLPALTPLPRADRAGWLLAASTHEGEDAAILDAFAASGFGHLILAPRHPSRAPTLAAMLTARGLKFDQRSAGAVPGGARVLLADTLGEMDLWYARCGACLIGGSLVDKGGHTPWEPARHACAILHGPSTWNFAAPFAHLDAAGGALAVTAPTLTAALATLDAGAQDRLARAASAVLQATGDADAFFHNILTHSRLL